jgi:hypothetical protein
MHRGLVKRKPRSHQVGEPIPNRVVCHGWNRTNVALSPITLLASGRTTLPEAGNNTQPTFVVVVLRQTSHWSD